jgi:hypothetical protein
MRSATNHGTRVVYVGANDTRLVVHPSTNFRREYCQALAILSALRAGTGTSRTEFTSGTDERNDAAPEPDAPAL